MLQGNITATNETFDHAVAVLENQGNGMLRVRNSLATREIFGTLEQDGEHEVDMWKNWIDPDDWNLVSDECWFIVIG